MRVRVLVRLKPGILDVPGTSVKRSLQGLGFGDVVDLRMGKVIDIDLDTDDAATARQRTQDMCERLLANPVIERYTIEIAPAGPDDPCQRQDYGVH
jgi:phosphoribosylformylglycinamidine synthase PurS subunit